MNKLNVHAGTLRDMGDRFINAWNRAEAGDDIKAQHVTFFTWEALSAALTPKRLELLRHLHREGAKSISALARTLERDYKRVHEDVTDLEAAGLIVREGNRLSAPWDTLATDVAS
ncbi:helix-turn-helix domain-containing protein [Paraburkholderia madseniana]|uniref:Helix-turn-helix domain-containing protein n=1 Tax=Paraburkholderia madseniana TaxID=2599607 RepID=A0A6N6WHP5_9BURK|nr:helix-turn-helix domain-containing protein [Paraburkholderia madseniana]KAE8759314.1 helix-turn-helix domain-containing protein [Paraburkholderia madseniana]